MPDLIALVANDLHQEPRKIGKDYFFKCPFHSGGNEHTPSLKISNGDTAHNPGFYCFGCNEHGGAVGYFLKRGYTLEEARQKAGAPSGPIPQRAQAPEYAPPETPPAQAWQERAQDLIIYAREQLHAGQGLADWMMADPTTGAKAARRITGLEWLIERGINEPTAERWLIGYNPRDIYDTRARWGLPDDPERPKIWIPQGLIIPHVIAGKTWGIKIRRPQGDPKYIHIPGSIPALYMADNLASGAPIILTEGEIDALTLWQEAGDLASIATLGSATNGKHLNVATWGLYFLQSDRRYTVYDLDEAGRKGEEPLQDFRFRPLRIPKIKPWHKDVNDYYNATGKLREWAAQALAA